MNDEFNLEAGHLGLSDEEADQAEEWFVRYQAMQGIADYDPPDDPDRSKRDRVEYSKYYLPPTSGGPVFDLNKCLSFMHEAGGIPLQKCYAFYLYNEAKLLREDLINFDGLEP